MTEEVAAAQTENVVEETKPVEVDDSEIISKLPQLEQTIIKQLEYYFSEANLRRDKFMNTKIAENEDGWVDLSVMLTFNRLKEITTEADAIVEALSKSPHGIVQVSEDKTKVRRHPDNPLPEFNEARRKETQDRTAYAKGFALDATLSEVIDFFHTNFKQVEQVQMRKYFDKEKSKKYLFKGSVFVTFATKVLAEEFVAQPDLMYKEKPLLRYMQEKYFEVKKQENEERKKRRNEKKKETEAKPVENKEPINLPKGTILSFTGIEEGEFTRENIKEAVSKVDATIEIAFVNFKRGDKDGHLRFAKEDDGKKFLEKLGEEKVKLDDTTELAFKLLEGDDEEHFLFKAVEDMKSFRNKQFDRNRKGGHGKFGSNRKRRNGNDDRHGGKKARAGGDDD